MSNIVNVDTSDPDLTKPYEPKVVPAGKHVFVVANDVKVEPCKDSPNQIIKIELRCQDESEFKGTPVFDNIVLITIPVTDGRRKSVKIIQGRLAQASISLGIKTEADFAHGDGAIPLDQFKGMVCEAITKVVNNEYPVGSKNFTPQAEVVRYLFEPVASNTAAAPASV